jgi:hypothetical protein
MAADREVTAAVSAAIEDTIDDAAEPAVLRQPVFEDDVPPVERASATPPARPAPAQPLTSLAPAAGPMVRRGALESALKSVLTSAGPAAADPDVVHLLEGVRERVLAGDTGSTGTATTTDANTTTDAAAEDLTGTGRHRFPEWLEESAADEPVEARPVEAELVEAALVEAALVEAALVEAALVEAELVDAELLDGELFDGERFDAELFDDARFDDGRFDSGLFGTHLLVEEVQAEQVRIEQIAEQLPVAARSTPATGWVEPARVHDIRTPQVHAADVRTQELRIQDFRTQDIRLEMGEHEVLAHREPLVMTPSMAAWPAMARTASDPAPLPMDATTILPPLSLLPPQRMATMGDTPPLLRGRPAVPPSRRAVDRGASTTGRPVIGLPSVPASGGRPADQRALDVTSTHRDLRLPLGHAPVPNPDRRLATVTRLVRTTSTELAPFGLSRDDELVVRLLALGLPEFLIAPDFAADAAVRGTYAALTRTLGDRLPPLPEVPTEPGDVLLVVGPGPDALAAGRSLAAALRLDPARVQWATPSDAAHLAPAHSRITTLEAAAERHEHSRSAGSVTIVAVDAPLRTGGGGWLAQMLSIWSPVAVWGVVDATRKLEDVVPWLDGLPRLDAVMVQDTDCTADPAAVLSHLTAPVARVDGARATAHRWASLLCERLEEMH